MVCSQVLVLPVLRRVVLPVPVLLVGVGLRMRLQVRGVVEQLLLRRLLG